MAFLSLGESSAVVAVLSKVFIIERKSGALLKLLDMNTVSSAPEADKSGKLWYTAEIQTLCAAISPHDRWVAVSDNRKRLFVWNLNDLAQLPKCITIRKQATSLCFSSVSPDNPSSGKVIVADRFGHVTEYPISELSEVSSTLAKQDTNNGEDMQAASEEPTNQTDFSQDFTSDTFSNENSAMMSSDPQALYQPFPPDVPDELEEDEVLPVGNVIAGEVSIVLDVALSHDQRYLAVCDRDEKIRISHYPNAYNIVRYCLGHEEFVRTLAFISLPCGGLPPKHFLISGSGDRSFVFWDYLAGRSLLRIELPDSEDKGIRKVSVCEKHSLISVLRDKAESVLVYKVRCLCSPDETKIQADLVKDIEIDQDIWSAMLDCDGKLWVLTRKQPGSQVENANAIETYQYVPESNSMKHCRDFAYKTALEIGKVYEHAWEDMPRLAKMTGFRAVDKYRERQEEKFRSKRARLEDFEEY